MSDQQKNGGLSTIDKAVLGGGAAAGVAATGVAFTEGSKAYIDHANEIIHALDGNSWSGYVQTGSNAKGLQSMLEHYYTTHPNADNTANLKTLKSASGDSLTNFLDKHPGDVRNAAHAQLDNIPGMLRAGADQVGGDVHGAYEDVINTKVGKQIRANFDKDTPRQFMDKALHEAGVVLREGGRDFNAGMRAVGEVAQSAVGVHGHTAVTGDPAEAVGIFAATGLTAVAVGAAKGGSVAVHKIVDVIKNTYNAVFHRGQGQGQGQSQSK